jgi:hypothetical protein
MKIALKLNRKKRNKKSSTGKNGAT